MKRHDLCLDVSEAGDEPLRLAASLFLPDCLSDAAAARSECPLELLVCVPGGTYTRFYWQAEIPGFSDYSFATHMSGRGKAVLTIDVLGTGESSQPPSEERLSRALVASTQHLATQEVVAGLRQGRWNPATTGRSVTVTGVGHSMGGMGVIGQQAAHRSFDRLAVFGFTNIGLDFSEEDRRKLAATAQRRGYLAGNRAAMRRYFHAADVPEAVIAHDDAQQTHVPGCLGAAAIVPGGMAEAAATIETPVYLLFGDIDVSPDPRREVATYSRARDISLYVLPGAAHCHNFATTRALAWNHFDRWVDRTLAGR